MQVDDIPPPAVLSSFRLPWRLHPATEKSIKIAVTAHMILAPACVILIVFVIFVLRFWGRFLWGMCDRSPRYQNNLMAPSALFSTLYFTAKMRFCQDKCRISLQLWQKVLIILSIYGIISGALQAFAMREREISS